MDNTFSIVGICPKTGSLGVAVATARIAVGNRVPFALAGVGAIATQADTNVNLGYQALDLLRVGKTASQALELVMAKDEGREHRQLIIIDSQGNTAGFTGKDTIPAQGHLPGPNCIVAGNMLTNLDTLEAMVEGFGEAQGPLEDKLLRALARGQRAGGDKRGKESAALLVVREDRHPYLDLRVDLSKSPIDDLQLILQQYKKQYNHIYITE